ncbi:hypothetical protein VNO77_03778 [Canavalia gladiata]|uniref:Uncharacterized protein n=1 Tax=Canavalia gladiata TaxID=3824 RepID=A0AAN9N1S3_CANGL
MKEGGLLGSEKKPFRWGPKKGDFSSWPRFYSSRFEEDSAYGELGIKASVLLCEGVSLILVLSLASPALDNFCCTTASWPESMVPIRRSKGMLSVTKLLGWLNGDGFGTLLATPKRAPSRSYGQGFNQWMRHAETVVLEFDDYQVWQHHLLRSIPLPSISVREGTPCTLEEIHAKDYSAPPINELLGPVFDSHV